MSQVGSELLKSSRVRPNCTHYCETYESIIQTLPVAPTSGEKGMHFTPSAGVLITRPLSILLVYAQRLHSVGDFAQVTENILPSLTAIWVSSPFKQGISSLSLFRLNKDFLVCHRTSSASSAVHLCLCKIYEKCPGAHEMLPHLILCDRITSVSVARQEVIQDGVHHSQRERGKNKGERDSGRKRGGGVMERSSVSSYYGLFHIIQEHMHTFSYIIIRRLRFRQQS